MSIVSAMTYPKYNRRAGSLSVTVWTESDNHAEHHTLTFDPLDRYSKDEIEAQVANLLMDLGQANEPIENEDDDLPPF